MALPGRHQMLGGESSDPDVIGEDAMAAHLRGRRSIDHQPAAERLQILQQLGVA